MPDVGALSRRTPARRLALIGNGISRSLAPRLHFQAGAQCGLEITYDLIDLEGEDPAVFEETLIRCGIEGYWGVNVTYPFKERAAKVVSIPLSAVQEIASVNTVLFAGSEKGTGYNTDYSGFLRAFRRHFPDRQPGIVGLVGTGGVGRPVSFGLAQLGAQEIRLHDMDHGKAVALALLLQRAAPRTKVVVCRELADAVIGVEGLVNCTPLGMWQHPGTPIPAELIGSQRWAFDVIYTPLETQFLADARKRGLALLSGYELFFYQGADAFERFTGLQIDEDALRAALGSHVQR